MQMCSLGKHGGRSQTMGTNVPASPWEVRSSVWRNVRPRETSLREEGRGKKKKHTQTLVMTNYTFGNCT